MIFGPISPFTIPGYATAAAGCVGAEVVRTIDSGFRESGLRFEGRA